MKRYVFICLNCLESQSFNFISEEKCVCPICKSEMYYWYKEETDDVTGQLKSREFSQIEPDFSKIQKKQNSPIVECPYCHSKNTSKISTFSKVMNIQLGGMYGAIKANKNWQCHDCGSEF